MTQTPPPQGTAPDPAQDLEQGSAFQPQFNADGLIAAIVTDAASGAVLMFAWMNAQALRHSLETGIAHFWSRSRKKLWRKGEESGNTLAIREIRVDCDQDALWLRVSVGGEGVTCHTGARSCFYRSLPVGTGEAPKLVRSDL
jgi:phosphoribosyl-AMP cyclohydrolase